MQTKRGKWAWPALLGCVCGRVQGTRKGFAFLLAEDGGEDVFLPQDALRGAMHGDRVLVRTFAPNRRGKGLQREGEVLRILQRARQTAVSYTHLDVYKRQSPYGPSAPARPLRQTKRTVFAA